MVNFWAVIVSALLNLVVGGVWYSSLLFGRMWIRYAEITEEKAKRLRGGTLFSSSFTIFLGSLVMAYILNYFLVVSGAARIVEGLSIAFSLWLGFVAATHLGSILFERRPIGYYWITTFYYLAILLLDSLILTIWR